MMRGFLLLMGVSCVSAAFSMIGSDKPSWVRYALSVLGGLCLGLYDCRVPKETK